jgi:hypothetical protein
MSLIISSLNVSGICGVSGNASHEELAMKINCQEHRKTMELLSLKQRLEEGISDPKELKKVKERIKTLERELQLD